jgi:hypothetical protein
MEQSLLLSPIIQYGFLGFSAVLLGIIVWLITQLLDLLTKTNAIIQANTGAITDLDERTREELKILRVLNEKLLSRPCMTER